MLLLAKKCAGFLFTRGGSSRWHGSHGLTVMTASLDAKAQIYEEIKREIKFAVAKQQVPPSEDSPASQFGSVLSDFLDEYTVSNIEAGEDPEVFKKNVMVFLKGVQEAVTNPYQFSPYHQAVRTPFDFYQWGNDFLRPLVIAEQSRLVGREQAEKLQAFLAQGHNVIILSNHQTEADPQVISILLEREGLSDLAEKIVFIAGHKVTNDPVAIPFSMGRNLICIHSKKHIKNPPEDIPRKQAQNLQSMQALSSLLAEGGKVFWVAPSGGRDRPNEQDRFVVAPFDLKALDMFKLLAMQSPNPTHFFPMAMYTHKLVPPPKMVSSGLGETRSAKRGAVSVAFLPETDGLGGLKDKEFAQDLQHSVEVAYDDLSAWHDAHQK